MSLALLLLLAAPAHAAPTFCGLARTRNGFDYVRAASLACAAARTAVVAIERGARGRWECSRSARGAVELTCRRARARIELLERSPVAAIRRADVVTLANWTFRLRAGSLRGRAESGRWVGLGRGRWCVPDVPREVLVAFALRPLTPSGGCFAAR